MDFSIIFMGVGILCIIISFFLKDPSKKIEKDLEELSISIYQETNALKRRLRVVEEELLLEPNFQVKPPNVTKGLSETVNHLAAAKEIKTGSKTNMKKPINEILVRQVIELNKQGYPITEISKMSTLDEVEIQQILTNHGGRR